MPVLALKTLLWHSSTRLHVCQCFHCVIRDSAHLTSFQLKNAFERKKILVLTLYNLILHSSMRWPVSQCFHCVVTDSAQKRVYSAK